MFNTIKIKNRNFEMIRIDLLVLFCCLALLASCRMNVVRELVLSFGYDTIS